MRKSVISALSLLVAVSVNCANADEITPSGATVITENFKVVKPSEKQSVLIVREENELGKLGDKVVVSGDREPSDIAFVQTRTGSAYIIKNKLLVQCVKGKKCVPSGIESRSVSRNVYEITVADYDEWKSLQSELKKADGVRKVSPSFYSGKKPLLK